MWPFDTNTDPNNIFAPAPMSNAEILFKLASALGPLAPFIGGTRTPMGRALGAGSVLAGGIGGTFADIMEAQRKKTPLEQQMLLHQMAGQAAQGATVAVPGTPGIAESTVPFPEAATSDFYEGPLNPTLTIPAVPAGPATTRRPQSEAELLASITDPQQRAAVSMVGAKQFVQPTHPIERTPGKPIVDAYTGRVISEGTPLPTPEEFRASLGSGPIPTGMSIQGQIAGPGGAPMTAHMTGLGQAESDRQKNDPIYQRFSERYLAARKANPDVPAADVAAAVWEDPNEGFVNLPDTYPGVKLAKEHRQLQEQMRREDARSERSDKRSAQIQANSDKRFLQYQANADRKADLALDPPVKAEHSGLWWDSAGNAMPPKEVVGKKTSEVMAAGGIRLGNARQADSLRNAKRLVKIYDDLDELAPRVLKKYGGNNLGQIISVQGNRLVVSPARRGAGDPDLKRFTAALNDSLITLPQALNLPPSREGAKLLERMEKGSGSLGDSVESLRAVNEQNLSNVNAAWAPLGIDITSDPKRKKGPPTAPGGNPYAGKSDAEIKRLLEMQ